MSVSFVSLLLAFSCHLFHCLKNLSPLSCLPICPAVPCLMSCYVVSPSVLHACMWFFHRHLPSCLMSHCLPPDPSSRYVSLVCMCYQCRFSGEPAKIVPAIILSTHIIIIPSKLKQSVKCNQFLIKSHHQETGKGNVKQEAELWTKNQDPKSLSGEENRWICRAESDDWNWTGH